MSAHSVDASPGSNVPSPHPHNTTLECICQMQFASSLANLSRTTVAFQVSQDCLPSFRDDSLFPHTGFRGRCLSWSLVLGGCSRQFTPLGASGGSSLRLSEHRPRFFTRSTDPLPQVGTSSPRLQHTVIDTDASAQAPCLNFLQSSRFAYSILLRWVIHTVELCHLMVEGPISFPWGLQQDEPQGRQDTTAALNEYLPQKVTAARTKDTLVGSLFPVSGKEYTLLKTLL